MILIGPTQGASNWRRSGYNECIDDMRKLNKEE